MPALAWNIVRLAVYAGLLAPLAFMPWVWHGFSSGKAWWFQSVVGLAFPVWCLWVAQHPNDRPPNAAWVWVVLAQLGSWSLSTLFSVDVHQSFFGATDRMDGLLTQLHLHAWFLMALTVFQRPNERESALKWAAGIGALAVLIALLQIPFPRLLGNQAGARVSGTFGNASALGAYLAPLFFVVVLVAWESKSRRARACWAAVGALTCVALFLTGSRGALLGLLAGLGATVFWISLSRRWSALVATLSLLGASGGLSAYWLSPSGHITQAGNRSHFLEAGDLSLRVGGWRIAFRAFQDAPWLGHGPGNFEILYQRFFEASEGCWARALDLSHQFMLELLSGRGLLGAALFLAWLLIAGLELKRLSANARVSAALWAGMAVAALIPVMFNPHSIALYLWLLLATAHVGTRTSTPSAPRERPKTLSKSLVALALIMGATGVVWLNVLPAWASSLATRGMNLFQTQSSVLRPLLAWKDALDVPSPYLEEPLTLGSALVMRLSENQTLLKLPQWEQFVEQNRTLAARYERHHHRVRVRVLWYTALHWAGLTSGKAEWSHEAEAALQRLVEEQPLRQEVRFAQAEVLARRQKLNEAEATLRAALSTSSDVGEAHFRLGQFRWKYFQDAQGGASMISQGAHAACAFRGANAFEMAQVAQSLFLQRDFEGLAMVAATVNDRPEDQSGNSYLQLATFLEQANLMSQRDAVLEAGKRFAPAKAAVFERILRGDSLSD